MNLIKVGDRIFNLDRVNHIELHRHENIHRCGLVLNWTTGDSLTVLQGPEAIAFWEALTQTQDFEEVDINQFIPQPLEPALAE